MPFVATPAAAFARCGNVLVTGWAGPPRHRDVCGKTGTGAPSRDREGVPGRGSGPAEAFQFARRPVERLVEGFALRGVLGDHLRHRRLRENLVGDARRGRRTG